jgi:putative hydroxymethylpyrimidine transport system substrate-binding protein
MKSSLVVIFALALAVLLPLPANAGERLTVLLDWYVNPDHAPLYVALEKGMFAARGLEVDLIAPSNPNDPPKLVAAGKADIAISYQYQHQVQVEQGLPLTRIATLIATPLNCLVVTADSGIASPAGLKGKKVGYSVGGFETTLLQAMLEREGVKIGEVELVNVNFSLAPALLSGQVDGVVGAFRNFELNQMLLQKRPGRAFYVEEYGIPAYDELIFVAARDTLADPRLRAFVDALEEGVQFLVNHPEESWKLFVGHGRGHLDDELNRLAWRDTLPRFALRPGALDRRRYLRFAEFLRQRGMVSAIPPLDNWAVELP